VLRAIETAKCVIDVERPEEMFLPSSILPPKAPNAVRYEALPKTISFPARLKQTRVFHVGSHEHASFLGNVRSKGIVLAEQILGAIRETRVNIPSSAVVLFDVSDDSYHAPEDIESSP
jgi:hypothetical protein